MEDIKEKTADEMFEELGYIEKFTYDKFIVYRTDSSHSVGHSIEFFTDKHKVFNSYNTINMQELQAINKKCFELRLVRR